MPTPPADTTPRNNGFDPRTTAVVVATLLAIMLVATLDGIPGRLFTRGFAAMAALGLVLRGGLALHAAIACWRERNAWRGLLWCTTGTVWLLLAILALSIAWSSA